MTISYPGCLPGSTTIEPPGWSDGGVLVVRESSKAAPYSGFDTSTYRFLLEPVDYLGNTKPWTFLGCAPAGYTPETYSDYFTGLTDLGVTVAIGGSSGGGGPFDNAPAAIPGDGLKARLAQLANLPGAEAVEAVNALAGTTGETFVSAVNILAGTVGESAKTALNIIAGTSGEESVTAARRIGGN